MISTIVEQCANVIMTEHAMEIFTGMKIDYAITKATITFELH